MKIILNKENLKKKQKNLLKQNLKSINNKMFIEISTLILTVHY